jgi:uncharacterized damage-inducible protein DinB
MLHLRYPIGRFEELPCDAASRPAFLSEMAALPSQLRAAVEGLADSQLDTPYRQGGWTARQVVHHLADAQMNWYVRTRLALTEIEPQVRPYDEVLWAELPDARSGPVEPSLTLLDGLYGRWVALFPSLTDEQWNRKLVHPERGVFTLDATLPMHVWHGKHHTAHITELRKRMGW